jgi:hypothetical protein
MRTFLFTVVTFVLLASTAAAEPGAGPPPTQVTIEASREELKSRVSAFVSDITRQDAGSSDAGFSLQQPIAVWDWPLCFSVSGLPEDQGIYVLNRISDAADAAGAPLAKDNKCHPNFVVVATSQPEKLLRAWYHHDQLIYNCAFPMPVNEFVGTPRAVRVWYNMDLSLAFPGRPGTVDPAHAAHSLYRRCGRTPVAAGWTGSRVTSRLVPDFLSVLVVVDLKLVKGYQWAQVADYIAMSGLAKINRNRSVADAPSVLNLFDLSAAAAPSSLTDWDRAFLKALYNTDEHVARQRVAVVNQMVNEIQP